MIKNKWIEFLPWPSGPGLTSPNPMVGAVIIKDAKVIGEGFHERAGTDHAEVVAIKNAAEDVRGSTLYCNLEPCCHTDKRTPPCTDLIIESGIKKVILSNLDPNPKVSGKGIEILRDAGVEVKVGVLEEKGKVLNEAFFKYISTGIPFVNLKMAMSLDGKIALKNGESKWITCDESRKMVHEMRFNCDAIAVGRNTLNSDNPRLNIRDVDSKGKHPKRVVFGNPSKMKLESHLFQDEDKENTIIVTRESDWNECSESLKDFFQSNKIKVIRIDKHIPGSFLLNGLKRLGELGVTSILVEGGAMLYSSFIKESLYDRIQAFQAPMFIGEGINVVASKYEGLAQIERLKILSSKKVGVDNYLELGN